MHTYWKLQLCYIWDFKSVTSAHGWQTEARTHGRCCFSTQHTSLGEGVCTEHHGSAHPRVSIHSSQQNLGGARGEHRGRPCASLPTAPQSGRRLALPSSSRADRSQEKALPHVPSEFLSPCATHAGVHWPLQVSPFMTTAAGPSPALCARPSAKHIVWLQSMTPHSHTWFAETKKI